MTTAAAPISREAAALDRALAAGHMPAKHPDGYYVCESSTRPGLDHRQDVTEHGITCSCEGGRHECLHKAALRYCLLHGILGVYALCANCHDARVSKVGGWCLACANMRELTATERETAYEAPANEDVVWEAEQAIGERDYDKWAQAQAEAQAEAAPPANVVPFVERPALAGASAAYRAAIAREEAAARELSAQRAAARAAAPRTSNPLADFFA